MCRILIVEDEESLSSFVVKGFRKHGYCTTVVADGEEALRITKSHHYEAILLDLGLPIKDGWEVLKELRDRGDTSPVIIMTAMSDLRQDALAAYANDYLQKPFRFKELLTAVQQLVSAPRSLAADSLPENSPKKSPAAE